MTMHVLISALEYYSARTKYKTNTKRDKSNQDT